MNWDLLPNDIIKYIFKFRRLLTCSHPAAIKIQSIWKCYKIRVLVGRFSLLRYVKEFRIWNPTIFEFINRSRL